jgi:RNA polymerase sigma-70 factor (ECF subfamily)
MDRADSTCWTVVQGAAAGSATDREDFVRRYASVIRACLAARWQGSRHQQELDDGVQEVFLECFRQGGVLDRANPVHAGGFRSFLYGVVRNVALRIEARLARHRRSEPLEGFDPESLAADEPSLSKVFDQAWAISLVREAGRLFAEQAKPRGEEAVRRVELLRLRFQEGLPIREIARRWQVEPAVVHHQYAKARHEFKATLLQVLAFHQPGSAADLEQQCSDLLAILG